MSKKNTVAGGLGYRRNRVALLGDLPVGALTGEDEQKPVRWEQVPKAANDPPARLKTMYADGVSYGPPEFAHLNEAIYDLTWELYAELQVPLCILSNSAADPQLAPYSGFAPEFAAAFKSAVRPAGNIPVFSNLRSSGILERHPGFKVVFGES